MGALAEEKRLLLNIAKYGTPHEPKATTTSFTFRDGVELLEKTRAVTRLKKRTWTGYQNIYDKRLLPRFGDRQLNTISFSDVSLLDAEMVGAGLSVATRRNVMICVRSVVSVAKEHGKLAQLPDLPKLPRVERTILKTLTKEQVDALLLKASTRGRLVLALAAYAGLRAGEVRALRWRDTDLKKGHLVVRTAICRGNEDTPKSGDQRVIPIATPLKALLEATPRTSEHVAVTSSGKVWGEGGMIQVLRRAAKRAGIEGLRFRFHDLRHFFVTFLFLAGVPAHLVQALAGHSALSVTQRYAHTTQDDLTKAMTTTWTHEQKEGEPGTK